MLPYTLLDRLRAQRPLLHCISNLVSANDCANLALAVGASPIMAQAPQEMAQIAPAARALVLNTGTPSEEKFLACRLAGCAAQAAGRPVVLDPVGVGASSWRLEQVQALLEQVHPAILRVNSGEAAALLGQTGREQGVDSPGAPLEQAARLAGELARARQTVVLLSGQTDLITDGQNLWQVTGGSARMRTVTGAGCMLSVLCGAFAAVADSPLEGAAVAAALWKVCAKKAQAVGLGAGSFRVGLLDAASELESETLRREAQGLVSAVPPCARI